MTYELGFVGAALKEWRKLDSNTREQFKKKLAERLENPLHALVEAMTAVAGNE